MKKLTLLLLAGIMLLASCRKADGDAAGNGTAARAARPVKLAQVAWRDFEDRLDVQGSLNAKHYADVGPKLDGTLTEIRVDVGDAVTAGKTVLFVSDSRKRAQAKDVAEQIYLVARENCNVALANITRAQARQEKALKDRDRYSTLYKNGNVTVNDKERFDTEFLIADADLKLARANAMAAKAQMQQAKVSYDVAAKDLEDCTILAPLTGIVMRRDKEPGEHGGVGKSVVRIEGTDVLEAVAFIPGIYFNRIAPGKTTTRIKAEGVDAGNVTVTYRADTIDTTLRTFKIKALLDNASKRFASGMMTEMTLVMEKRRSLAVPTHCVIERGQGNVMFMAKEGKAVELIVKTGLVNDGYTEILSAVLVKPDGSREPFTLTPGTDIIYEGHYLVVNGDEIAVR